MNKKEEQPKVFKKKCEKCGKEISSLYEKQMEYNFKAHKLSCEVKEDVE